MSEPISNSSEDTPTFLTVDEAAALLRVNRKTLYEAIRLGQVPGVVRIGKALRIRRDALVTWPSGKGRDSALGSRR
ncbi:helix-turn-helix domain-containing protein [Myxococcus sp. CA056]|uniref:helix-turn-helix domain-containing protein n=1 Tax=unclassified Myxococcus TaxID=2648731 RepID=UPI00157B4CCF|nr:MULTISPECIES: helix-turn-helix domain-containing protein [unclassified Myxococcus]NTX15502.1 helix-turn-helix domain-containing protein [Myxococcus sp. CA056]NTX32838.1 helix-turn-helix domain-containing protein [Myxococcus sp. CA033]NTX51136.1 helix-turn-helix domain-containing protein [Myxococcus sp. CA039A]